MVANFDLQCFILIFADQIFVIHLLPSTQMRVFFMAPRKGKKDKKVNCFCAQNTVDPWENSVVSIMFSV